MPTTYVDPFGLETCVLVTRNSAGFGTHAALWTDGTAKTGGPFLYDPGGSYAPSAEGGGEIAFGDNASIDPFKEWHDTKDGDTTEMACADTSDEEEEKIWENLLNRGSCSFPRCATCVSTAWTMGRPATAV